MAVNALCSRLNAPGCMLDSMGKDAKKVVATGGDILLLWRPTNRSGNRDFCY